MATMRHLIVSLLLIFFFEVSTIQAQGRCRVKGLEGWTSMGSYCYQYFYSPVTFNQALINCRSYGGTLASVISETQNRQITGLITAKSFGTPRTWLGAQRTKNPGDMSVFQYGSFKWLDQNGFVYTRWAKGEPNNLFVPENCLEINYKGAGLWNDVRCSRMKPYVCQHRV